MDYCIFHSSCFDSLHGLLSLILIILVAFFVGLAVVAVCGFVSETLDKNETTRDLYIDNIENRARLRDLEKAVKELKARIPVKSNADDVAP